MFSYRFKFKSNLFDDIMNKESREFDIWITQRDLAIDRCKILLETFKNEALLNQTSGSSICSKDCTNNGVCLTGKV